MEFYWQPSRQESLYIETTEKRIYGFISWQDQNRLKIDTFAVNGKSARDFVSLGLYSDENTAKLQVEKAVASVFEPAQGKGPADVKGIASGLLAVLDKGIEPKK